MKIAMFGAGAVGGYFGIRLAQAGNDVSFIARGAHLAAIQNNGFQLQSISGDHHLSDVQASDDIQLAADADVVFVAVKSWDLSSVAAQLAGVVRDHCMVIPLLNGVEAPAVLMEALGAKRVLAGSCGVIAFIESPGKIKHTGVQPFMRFGEADNSHSERVKALVAAFDSAPGAAAEIPADIDAAMWSKFLVITAFSGVGAVSRVPIGEIRNHDGGRQMMIDVIQEVIAVATARGVSLPADSVEQTMAVYDAQPPESTTSMQRDLMAGRRSELEVQTGAVLRLGKKAGVPTPVNQMIYRCLLPQERRALAKAGG